ncbi:MAG: DUF494 family protein [bacterium]
MEYIIGKRIVEIINFLVKELLENDNAVVDEESIVQSLMQLGYQIEEINMAFVLIFSLEGRIEKQCLGRTISHPKSIRVLNVIERSKLTLDAQGLLINLRQENMITEDELERVLDVVIHQPEEVNQKRVWEIIEQIVADNKRYVLMTNHALTIDFFLSQENRQNLN